MGNKFGLLFNLIIPILQAAATKSGGADVISTEERSGDPVVEGHTEEESVEDAHGSVCRDSDSNVY